MRHRMTLKAGGYSLTELLTATTLATLLAATVVPISVRSVRWVQLRASANELTRELQRARMQALAENAPIRVEISAPNNRYQLVSAGDITSPRGAQHTLSEGVSFQVLPSRPIVFYPWGTAAPAGSYVLSGIAGKLRIVVHLTGRIRIEEVSL